MAIPEDVRSWLDQREEEARQKLEAAQAELEAIRLLRDSSARSRTRGSAASSQEVKSGVIKVLQENGKPLHRQVIYDRLKDLDISVNGRDPVANLGAILSRNGEFEPVGDGLWKLSQGAEEVETEESQLSENDGEAPTSLAALLAKMVAPPAAGISDSSTP